MCDHPWIEWNFIGNNPHPVYHCLQCNRITFIPEKLDRPRKSVEVELRTSDVTQDVGDKI